MCAASSLRQHRVGHQLAGAVVDGLAAARHVRHGSAPGRHGLGWVDGAGPVKWWVGRAGSSRCRHCNWTLAGSMRGTPARPGPVAEVAIHTGQVARTSTPLRKSARLPRLPTV
jgi:hypothetical protein